MSSDLDGMFRAAWAAREHALPVLSGYKVGAAIRSASGRVFTGCNFETETAKICLCAEVTALYKAMSEGEREFDRLVVAAERERPIVPCGHCRQVLTEFAPGLEVHSENQHGTRLSWRLADLLPESYRLERD